MKLFLISLMVFSSVSVFSKSVYKIKVNNNGAGVDVVFVQMIRDFLASELSAGRLLRLSSSSASDIEMSKSSYCAEVNDVALFSEKLSYLSGLTSDEVSFSDEKDFNECIKSL